MARTLLRRAVLALVFYWIAPAASAAEAATRPDEAQHFIQDLRERTVALLGQSTALGQLRFREACGRLIRQSFDLDTLGRYAAGPAWEAAGSGERQQYLDLYALWMLGTYLGHFTTGMAAEMTVVEARALAGSSDAYVRATLKSDLGPVDLSLRVRHAAGGMKIVDVVVWGLSLAMAQRADFSAVIERRGFAGLIADLRARLSETTAELR